VAVLLFHSAWGVRPWVTLLKGKSMGEWQKATLMAERLGHPKVENLETRKFVVDRLAAVQAR
jgi:hypothetical protein